jgi:hypothetical protein
MWMLDLSADATDAKQKAAGPGAGNELFSRDDGQGALIIGSGEKPAGASAAREIKLLFDGGKLGREGGEWLLRVGLWTPENYRGEFLAWYQVEHLPMLLQCSTWDGCRFVEESVDKGCQFYALHQLSDKKALDSDERKRSRATPWFKRLAANDWFDGGFTRALYRRIS